MAPPREKGEKVILQGTVRNATGKSVARSLRRDGWIPGVVYGEEKGSIPIKVRLKEFTRVLKTKAGENVLIALRLKGDSKELPESTVLIKELQYHPVSHQISHVDFHRISLTRRLTVTVPLVFQGEAQGVKNEGGILEHLRWDLQVECLPTQIPSEIPVDVSSLDVGQSLLVKSIPLPEGVRLVTDGELPVVACGKPKEEVVAPAAAEVAPEAVEPEVIKQKKPEEIALEEEAKAREKEEKRG